MGVRGWPILRFNDLALMTQAKALQRAQQNGHLIQAFIVEEQPGNNILDKIIHHLTTCRMVVIFGAHYCGVKGTVNFSTKEELN